MNSEFTVEEKFINSIYNIKLLLPIYSIVYMCMDKIEDESVGTIGVTENKLIYNPKYIEKLSQEELNFINLHEILHVALKHVSRGKGKDPRLWNIASDLYVNRFIVVELNKKFSHLNNMLIGPGSTIAISNNFSIKFKTGGFYCNSINIEEDTVESIYKQLEKQAQSNGYNEHKNKLNGQSDQKFSFVVKGSDYGKKLGSDKTILDISINDDTIKDLISDSTSKEESEQLSNQLLSKVKTKSIMDNIQSFGNSTSNLEIEINKLLKSKLNWRKYIQKYCITLNSKDMSFRTPDKRMSYQKVIYPGQVGDEENALKGIKICIDTSGSISDKDFYYFIGQLNSLLNKYKVDAELIYWDAAVENCGKFNDLKSLYKIKAIGRGGTNVNCVFDYLKSKRCKTKPVLTVIFTDGYFSESFNTKENKKQFKDTLWVMNRNHNKAFKPSFGKVAVPDFPD